MANNYSSWAEEIGPLSETEITWLTNVLDEVWNEVDQGELRDVFGLNLPEDSSYWPGFEWSIENGNLWMGSDEDLDLDNLIAILQAFLRTFRSENDDEGIAIHWAYTCSKLRPGEFGGGVAVITAHDVRVGDICDLEAQLIAEMKGETR